MRNDNEIISQRPFLNWGYPFEIGRSNGQEDAFVMEYFDKKDINRKRLVVDIGAADGLTGSNSRRLIIDKGWRGILVEPYNPFYTYLLKLYENSDEVTILNYACDSTEKETDLFSTGLEESAGLTSLLRDREWPKSQKIQTRLFNNIIPAEYIDFLSLDTEGKDLEILKSIDFNKYSIEIISVEKGPVEYNESIFKFLGSKGYSYSLTTNHNFLFVKK